MHSCMCVCTYVCMCVRMCMFVCSVYYMFSRTRNVVRPWLEHARVGADGYVFVRERGVEGWKPPSISPLPRPVRAAAARAWAFAAIEVDIHPRPDQWLSYYPQTFLGRSHFGDSRGSPDPHLSIPLSVDSILFRRSSQSSLSSLPLSSTCMFNYCGEKLVCSLSGISKEFHVTEKEREDSDI